jgi:S-(hydroxymethyl)glutathione dehydrogenase / alcohol dehydrogenase
MKSTAALITEIAKPFEIGEVEVDTPIRDEVLVEVKASSLCHSDLHLAHNDYGLPLPILLGHEFSGIVREVGPEVKSVNIGDHVVACVVPSCGTCDRCAAGWPSGCRNSQGLGRTPDENPRISFQGEATTPIQGLSGFTQFTLLGEKNLVTVNKEIPFDRASLLGCGVVTGAGAVLRSARVQAGETVAVFGAGGVGLNAVQAASLVGARRVIVVDLQQNKLELAKKFGATDLVNPADGDAIEQIMAITEGRGVDHAFEIIGIMPTLQQAVQSLGHRGTAYVVGMQKPGAALSVNVDPMDTTSILQGEKAVRGVMMGSTNFKLDIPLYADLYAQGRYNLDDLVEKNISLDEINRGYEELETGRIARNVITF